MRAMVLVRSSQVTPGARPLEWRDVGVPQLRQDEVLIRVRACGVCHTDLDEIEGRTQPSSLPRIPGHQIVGTIESTGSAVDAPACGSRVGVAWLSRTCGRCRFCLTGNENLCADFVSTGLDVDGGYAELVAVPATATFPIPETFSDVEAAPLLCAGAIGYRSLELAGIEDGDALGLSGFGASAHLVLQLARHRYPRSPVFVFARGEADRQFARDLGATWAGDTLASPPSPLAAIIDTTPAWRPVVTSLRHLDRGGRLVINAIRKDDRDKAELLSLDHARDLWLEREIKSVANITRADVRDFLQAAAAIPLRPRVTTFPLADANDAIAALASGRHPGAIVLTI
jgi:propanol-preferring alcohol dehydrogenase